MFLKMRLATYFLRHYRSTISRQPSLLSSPVDLIASQANHYHRQTFLEYGATRWGSLAQVDQLQISLSLGFPPRSFGNDSPNGALWQRRLPPM